MGTTWTLCGESVFGVVMHACMRAKVSVRVLEVKWVCGHAMFTFSPVCERMCVVT